MRTFAKTQIPATITSTEKTSSPTCSGYTAGRLGAIVLRRSRFHICRQTTCVEPFGIAVIVIAILGAIAAIVSSFGSSGVYEQIGTGAFALDRDEQPRGPKPGSQAALAEQAEEVRQMIQARSDRAVDRGEAPLDVDAEVAALLRPAVGDDPELRDEVRQLVIARNERRMRRGEEPLDVEAEVERQMRDLGA